MPPRPRSILHTTTPHSLRYPTVTPLSVIAHTAYDAVEVPMFRVVPEAEDDDDENKKKQGA